jgi:hypothetical protein
MGSEKRRSLIHILHFNPLERFPPAMNLLSILEHDYAGFDFVVYTTHAADMPFKFANRAAHIRIKRLGSVSRRTPALVLFWSYLHFHFHVLWEFIIRRPGTILYFETFSALIPAIYKKFLNPSVRLFVHYHEYVTRSEYRSGPSSMRIFHKLEQLLYPEMTWISQTNKDRMDLFIADQEGRINHPHIMPNYPPASWNAVKARSFPRVNEKIGFLYVGSMDLDHMYTKEMASFILSQPDRFYWDIYSENISKEALQYLNSLPPEIIKFKGGIPYSKIPEVASFYHIGVILYKGHLKNFVYNVPNKLYEYHVCGLDVWFPLQLKSALFLETTHTFPRIKGVDFDHLDVGTASLLSHDGLVFNQKEFTAETAVSQLISELVTDRP